MASMKLLIFCVALLSIHCQTCKAQEGFRLANIYADEMVLQMAPKRTQIWGWGDVGTSVNVIVDTSSESTTVNSDGKWSVRLPPQNAGGPYQLAVTHGDNETISINVWFGDVWVCSGQSNMQMTLSQTFNPVEETEKAVTYQNIRLLQIRNQVSEIEIEEIEKFSLRWSAPTEQNVQDFSSLCIMFGERMSDSLGGRPIGLIDTTWGGTYIEAWSSTRVTNYCNAAPNVGNGGPNGDHVLWNGMVKPLTNMAVRGAIWYQGESNSDHNSDYYACHIQRLAEDWKNTFVDGTVPVPEENNIAFPFGIAQIGTFSDAGPSNYGFIRWHQSIDTGVQPNLFMPEGFMAAAYDLTDAEQEFGGIHPRDKQTVADRLANAGKALLYSENWRMNGPAIVATSENSPGILTLTYDMDIIVQGTSGFSIRDSNGTWIETTISSSSGRDVDVNIESGATHLAYAWSGVVCDYKMCSIYSDDDELLPAQVWLWNLDLQKSGY